MTEKIDVQSEIITLLKEHPDVAFQLTEIANIIGRPLQTIINATESLANKDKIMKGKIPVKKSKKRKHKERMITFICLKES